MSQLAEEALSAAVLSPGDVLMARGVAAIAVVVVVLVSSFRAQIRVHLEAKFPVQADLGQELGLSEASCREGGHQQQVGCLDHQIGSAADLLVGVLVQPSHSRAVAARVGQLHQAANCVGGLVAQSSDWGFGCPKAHCLT